MSTKIAEVNIKKSINLNMFYMIKFNYNFLIQGDLIMLKIMYKQFINYFINHDICYPLYINYDFLI